MVRRFYISLLVTGLAICTVQPRQASACHSVHCSAPFSTHHTGAATSECMDKCLSKWEIGLTAEKVMLVVSDNGSIIIKAINS